MRAAGSGCRLQLNDSSGRRKLESSWAKMLTVSITLGVTWPGSFSSNLRLVSSVFQGFSLGHVHTDNRQALYKSLCRQRWSHEHAATNNIFKWFHPTRQTDFWLNYYFLSATTSCTSSLFRKQVSPRLPERICGRRICKNHWKKKKHKKTHFWSEQKKRETAVSDMDWWNWLKISVSSQH